VPISILPSSENELLKAALDLLKLKRGTSERQNARAKIEQICAEFGIALEEALASPLIGETRTALKLMADDAAALAERLQMDDGRFMLGAATFNWGDAAERAAKRQEIEDLREFFAPVARELSRISEILRERVSQWDGKRTGELHTYEMVYGAPKKQLAGAAARLFYQYRPNDLNAGRKGDFYRFLEYLFEIATNKEPSGDELLRHAQEAVKAIQR